MMDTMRDLLQNFRIAENSVAQSSSHDDEEEGSSDYAD